MLNCTQSEKIYNSFLSVLQEGFLTDPSGGATDVGPTDVGAKIDCRQTIFIFMTNLCQEEIIQFAAENERVYQKQFDDEDLYWIQQELVTRRLEPKILRFFSGIKSTLAALHCRFDKVIPFLPFTKEEQMVVGDTEIRSFLSRYCQPPVLEGKEEERRILGNFLFHYTKPVVVLASEQYKPMEGASSLLKYVSNDIVPMLQVMRSDGDLKLAPYVILGNKQVQQCWLTIEDGRCAVIFKEPKEELNSEHLPPAKQGKPVSHAEAQAAGQDNDTDTDAGAGTTTESTIYLEQSEGPAVAFRKQKDDAAICEIPDDYKCPITLNRG